MSEWICPVKRARSGVVEVGGVSGHIAEETWSGERAELGKRANSGGDLER